MVTQVEKVYVAVGNDKQDGFGALEWALKKWSSHSISIVIIHATNFKDFVYTPFGKLPPSSVNDELLEGLRKSEQEKVDKLLSEYIAFCGEVKAEILKVGKYDEPMHKIIIDLILGLQITKLVMGITFMKSSSGKSKNAISASFYVHRQKPDFCELFIICDGKSVFLREGNDEGFMEDGQGVMVAKSREKASFKGWLEKMFAENFPNNTNHGKTTITPSTSTSSSESRNQWENYVQQIEDYYQELLSSYLNEDSKEDDVFQTSPTKPDVPTNTNSNMSVAEKIEVLRAQIEESDQTTKLKRKEAKDSVERHARAERAICLCNGRVEELEASLNEEMTNRIGLQRDLDAAKEYDSEVVRDILESKSRLNSILELQSELSNKLNVSSLAKSRAEAQLEKAAFARAEMVREIEELRRQRDVLHRRIEFCREKDAIGMAARLTELSCSYREYTAEEIRLATDDFSERLRLKSGGDWTRVYRGRINHATVAIKMLNVNGLSQEVFEAKVKLLSQIRHPHLVPMIGFCHELKCIVFEYMHNGSLRDILFSPQRNSRMKNKALHWPDRIRIAAEVCSGMGFLHSAKPKPLTHGNLNPSNILLDRNLVAKINGIELTQHCDEQDVRTDVHAFGVLLLQLLTGRNWGGVVEEVMNSAALIGVLDTMAGEWPLNLAEELVRIAKQCMSTNQGANMDVSFATIMKKINDARTKAAELVARQGREVAIECVHTQDVNDVPRIFICPIFQEVMKNPYVAADGFSYELDAIEEWLGMGHETSPMTNLRLKHKRLTPNHTLRSLIQDWHNKRSIPLP